MEPLEATCEGHLGSNEAVTGTMPRLWERRAEMGHRLQRADGKELGAAALRLGS
jgi:hypothetical protein